VFGVNFGIVSLYRTIALCAHLRRLDVVRTLLASSGWQRELRGLSIWNHVIHGYVTGLVAHACVLMPHMIFWRLTHPTFMREVLLTVWPLAVLLSAVVRKGLSFETVWFTLVDPLAGDVATRGHEHDHSSRFYFAVFHGHHHDAIPSAVIGALEAGFVEAIHKGIGHLGYLRGATIGLAETSLMVIANMKAHAYIPGIFPYSRWVVEAKIHHVVHHYGSLRPLGLNGLPSYKQDLAHGYDPKNNKALWFLATTDEHEGIGPELRDSFVEI
jgi:hypothetical protein